MLNNKGEIERHKARLVTWQRPLTDFEKTLAPLVSIAALDLPLTVLGGSAGMTIKHLDLTTAFLESMINKGLYMTLLKGVILYEENQRVGSGSQVYMRLQIGLYDSK